jgi:DNA processing protein
MRCSREIFLCAVSRKFLFRPAEGRTFLSSSGYVASSGGSDVTEYEIQAELFDSELMEEVSAEAEWCKCKGIKILSVIDSEYPDNLRECVDAPVVLYYIGNAKLNNSKIISIIGTRLVSSYGRECCSIIVKKLAERGYDPLIVSGLAYGADICAQRAALDSGLETVAILPNGLDMIYPAKHRGEACRMILKGGLITEFPRGVKPLKINFIKRNRIIAGIAHAVVVIETRIKGGAMSTVEFANSYDRDVFALPGHIMEANSYGCNYLISKNMAHILNSADIIPELLGWREATDIYLQQPNLFVSDSMVLGKVINLVKRGGCIDAGQLCEEAGMTFSQAASALLELELEGVIENIGLRGYRIKRVAK